MGQERTESEGFYEMLWDCAHCDTKGLLGKSQRHCANCGAPQDPTKRYFPKPEEQKRVDGHTFEGSDLHCPACSAPMGKLAKNCTQCGSPLDGSKEVQGIAAPVKAAAPKAKSRLWVYLVVIAVFVFAIWFLFFRKKDATLTVAAHTWTRVVAIEKFDDWKDEAWRDQVPSNANQPVLCTRKERSKKKVEDGEECNTERVDKKDGTFEQVRKCKPKYRSEPVEDDWCSFTVRAWKKASEEKASGKGLDPKWPDKLPAADVQGAQLGALRSGAKTETLTLDFGKSGTCDVNDATWRKYKDGAKVKMQVRARSERVVCDGL
jgi:hypothetical protein